MRCQHGFTISSWRHLSAAIARQYFRTTITGQALCADQIDEGYGSESGEEDTEDNSPWDREAGHESLTAGLGIIRSRFFIKQSPGHLSGWYFRGPVYNLIFDPLSPIFTNSDLLRVGICCLNCVVFNCMCRVCLTWPCSGLHKPLLDSAPSTLLHPYSVEGWTDS